MVQATLFRKSTVSVLFLFLLSVAAGASETIDFRQSSLTIETGDGAHTLDVEIAAKPTERERGLMFRKALDDDQGMLFIFAKPRDIVMWMKDTFIPLDMVFIGENNRVSHIHRNAKPEDRTFISSNGQAAFVLEIYGGNAKRLGIEVGDLVRGPAMKINSEN